ncbi:unnamed protein product [Ambrosiozyma monospora]|uniref:Unnamed protein product n=1 Tax=Ambrosiozyma monospora TaxID=43982 RepID=A0ACB5SWR0_AMBMO|nr:unnamed protein product [Ambrosiozyma monospora]
MKIYLKPIKTFEVRKVPHYTDITECVHSNLSSSLTEDLYNKLAPDTEDKPNPSYKEYTDKYGLPICSGIRASYPTFVQLVTQSLATGLTTLDLIDPLCYFPLSLSFDNLTSSNKEVHFNIDEIPIFRMIEKQSGKGFENMFFSLHANLYKNCTRSNILTTEDRETYTGILTGEELCFHMGSKNQNNNGSGSDDDVEMDDINSCEMPDASHVGSVNVIIKFLTQSNTSMKNKGSLTFLTSLLGFHPTLDGILASAIPGMAFFHTIFKSPNQKFLDFISSRSVKIKLALASGAIDIRNPVQLLIYCRIYVKR